MKHLSTLSLLFVLFTSAINIGGTKLSQNYSSSEHKYQISFPKGWKVDASNGADYIDIKGPVIDTVTKQTDGWITIVAQVNSKAVSTTENYKAKIAYLQSNAADLKIMEEGELTLGEVKSKYVIHRSKIDSALFTKAQFYFSNGKTSFILTGTVLGDNLGKYRDLYFDIAKSIKFSKK